MKIDKYQREFCWKTNASMDSLRSRSFVEGTEDTIIHQTFTINNFGQSRNMTVKRQWRKEN